MPARAAPLSKLFLLLLLAMLSMLAGCSERNAAASRAEQRIAQVNDSEISVHLLNQWLIEQSTQMGGPPPAAQADSVARAGLERLIDQELLVQQALQAKLDRDPAVLQALALARREVLARAYATRLAGSASAPAESASRQFYDARPALFAQRQLFDLRELLLPVSAEQFEALRQRLSRVTSGAELQAWLLAQNIQAQGNRSVQPAEKLPPELLQRLVQMQDGQALLMATAGAAGTSGTPVAARILIRVAAQPAPLSFEQARPAIEQRLQADSRREAVQAAMRTLRQGSEVRTFGRFAQAASAPESATPSSQSQTPSASASAAATEAALRKGLAGLK